MSIKSIIQIVDDINSDQTFGYTKNLFNVNINLDVLTKNQLFKDYEKMVQNSTEGLTTLFPIGRFIVILRSSKNKKEREMIFLDFRADYTTIDKASIVFSDNIVSAIKKIKFDWVEKFTPDMENFVILVHWGN